MAKLSKKTLDGNVETLILAVLGDGPTYGYDLVNRLNERGGGLLKMGEGTIYPVLHRMEERGLLTATWRDGPLSSGGGGRRRKYYRVTVAGKKAMAENRAQWQGLVTVMENVLKPGPRGAVKAV